MPGINAAALSWGQSRIRGLLESRAAVPALLALGFLAVLFRVLAKGFLPADDALRHAAKVVSGKPWQEILLIRPGITMDSHPGWHAFLGLFERFFGCSTETLVILAVALLFLAFVLPPLFTLARADVWPGVFLLFWLCQEDTAQRILYGRPFVVSMVAILMFSLTWRRLAEPRLPGAWMAGYAVLIAAGTWMHGTWYLYALPVSALLLCARWRAAARLAVSTGAGVAAGALLTGQPVHFLRQMLAHVWLSLGSPQLGTNLVGEFQPATGDPLLLLLVLALVLWRCQRGTWRRSAWDNPALVLALGGWALGFAVKRFWTDWGTPALMAWLAVEAQPGLVWAFPRRSWRRFLFLGVTGLALLLAVTADVRGRWTHNLLIERLSAADPSHRPWLPGPGGIVYTDNMDIFYQTFFANPTGDWRYVLGFEAGWMPDEDLETLRRIQTYGGVRCFEPWVAKMRPQDRLILRQSPANPPQVAGLEWGYVAKNTWVGRLPQQASPPR